MADANSRDIFTAGDRVVFTGATDANLTTTTNNINNKKSNNYVN